jgi:3-methyladenine DNA glycosylase AlkD
VIGSYLYDYDLPRDLLYDLAGSDNPWERRTAIVSTAWFIKKGELDDTFNIAEQLLDDEHEYVQKAAGSWLRHAGKQNEQRLLQFLEKNASKMERSTLTTAMEKLNKKQKEHFRNL